MIEVGGPLPHLVIPLDSLVHVVQHLPLPVVVTDSGGYVVGSSTTAQQLLASAGTEDRLHLDDLLAQLPSPSPTATRTPIACDGGAHQLVVLDHRPAADPATAEVRELAGAVAHDFNNLLGVIINYAALAALEAPEGSQQARDLAEVITASERAAEIADRLRRLSATGI